MTSQKPLGFNTMWRDISDDVELINGKIVHGSQEIGLIKFGMIGVLEAGYRVRLEREYDGDEPVTRFFIEHREERKFSLRPPNVVRPICVIHNMRVMEVGDGFFVIAEKVESFKKTVAGQCRIRMDSGQEFEVNFDAGRIKQKLEERTETGK